jgi:uncharacterized membrane protein YdbT with pleckstrin-like domain
MGYPRRLLSDDETIVLELKPHWRALIVPVIVLLAAVFVGTWTFSTWGSWFSGPVGSIGRWAILAVAVIVVVGFVLRPFAQWLSTQYVFTDRRIITRFGILSKHGRDMPLSKVNNVSFEVSMFGRLLNYGRLEIDSASGEGLRISDVPDVEVVQREIYRLHEEDDERRRQM